MSRTLFFLAGEASGDLHGGKLIAALKALDPSVRCVGMGGPQMAAAGLEVFKDLDGMQVVGFWEVAKRYGFFKQVFYQLLDRVKQEKPDALICIDYPGFNLRFAKEVKKLGIPCLYYIVPQVWAWKPKRAAKMAEFIDRAYCVFEFEPPFFDKFKSISSIMRTEFIGHPLLDRVAQVELNLPTDKRNVSFLSGSRPSEFLCIGRALAQGFFIANKKCTDLRALMSIPEGGSYRECREVEARLSNENIQLVFSGVGASEGISRKHIIVGPESEYLRCRPYLECRPRESPIAVFDGGFEVVLSSDTPEARLRDDLVASPHSAILPAISDFSVVKSGTSTLEAGLQGNPMCVVYRGGWVSYSIARMLVDIPVFSLVNIVLGKYAVPELLQSEVNPQRIAAEIERGLTDQKYIEQQRAALAELPKKLGGPGASKRAAERMLAFLDGRD